MRHRARRLALAVILASFAGGCTRDSAEPGLTQSDVEAFMQSCEADLRSRNREGVIARYDSAGVVMVSNGNNMFMPFDSIAATYYACPRSVPRA